MEELLESQFQKKKKKPVGGGKGRKIKGYISTKHPACSVDTACVDASMLCQAHFSPYLAPRLQATCTAVLVAFPLPTQGCLGSLPPSAWSSCPFRTLKLQRSSRDLILILFFSSPLSILFLFSLPVHLYTLVVFLRLIPVASCSLSCPSTASDSSHHNHGSQSNCRWWRP